MAADSPRRGVHKGAQVVSPQPIVDRSIIDSVAGIINDIVPQAYTGTLNSDNKESITWARFEYADINDPVLYPDYNEGSNTPPLLLVLGYTTGVQVWLIAATGEATEVLSWRQGVVRTLRILPNPKTDDENIDLFESKRPMVAVCDSAGPGPQFCNISFISLKTGEQAKSIKFKNPVYDILANKRSIVVTFLEKIAVFNARTLEDVLTVTTCYASPGPNPNPVALGTRWLAYSEKKLLPAKRSSGGCEGEGVQSYTATVLYAAKSLGKGLRGLGETVASSLSGNSASPIVVNNTGNDVTQPGVITVLDLQAAKEEKELDDANVETVIAHFTAHSDAIVAMTFDLSGALLLTADKRGHDFHVFRIQPHPGGPTLAAVHHLYILHRGDTTAKVQDMVFSSDTRWAAISTVRGTTHVFPVAPYGGPVGVRTHSTPHVVNRLSRFHRSAGLMDDGIRSHSPVSHSELPLSVYPYSNPRLPPYPHPTVLHPLAQIRQQSTLNYTNSQVQQSWPQQRQRLHSDDSTTLPLKICACFAPPRAWMYAQRESTVKVMKRAVDSLFIMACHGNMIQYDLEPKPTAGVPKEKVCDDTMIELEVEAKGQWPLIRSPNSLEIVPPLPASSSLLSVVTLPKDIQDMDLAEDRWLSQVEIVTHAGPHRRLWMGPQFVFKTYNATSGAPVNLVEAEAIEIGVTGGSRPARSNPVNMPHATSRSLVPVVIDGSGSSYEQSPRFMEAYGDSLDSESAGVGSGENQLREDLAEAMLETSIAPHRAPGRRSVFERVGQPVTKVVNPLGTVITVSADEEDANSSQEFDSAEESHVPEPPRSVCAEEGPASLSDLEPDSCQMLRDLTEICAEMRSASEPAIDSVPDENIREVRERRALCVEIAPITNPGNSSIDFGREEVFRDVPTSLSLCVEPGEIPSSPMTQAKETAWCKRLEKKEDKTHERNMSEAQYVVNCDDESVVLMENKLARRGSSHCKPESKRMGRREQEEVEKPGKKKNGGNSGKKESKSSVRKYVLKEHEDSIVIEDSSYCEDTKHCSRKREEKSASSGEGKTKCTESKSGDSKDSKNSKDSKDSKEPKDSKSKGKSKCSVALPDKKETKIDAKKPEKRMEPIVEIDSTPTEKKKELKVDVAAEPDAYKYPPSDSADDFSSSEYHIVETACCGKDNTLIPSDEDIEHIQTSEITQLQQAECCEGDKCGSLCCENPSPVLQRKNSKNTISDDDLEYIHSSELVETPDKKSSDDLKLETEKESDRDSNASKRTFSDDDLEHVQHSDVCAMTDPDKDEKKETQEQSAKPKSSKKTKDIVVIESDTMAADVTVIIKPAETWRGKEKMDEDEPAKDPAENPSPLKKIKTRQSKTSPSNVAPKRSPGEIEIIDIDAMQKAEMEVQMDPASTPECKILSGPEVTGTRAKKPRKNKKTSAESAQSIETPDPPKPFDEGPVLSKESSSQEVPEFSWSAIVKKKSPSLEPEPREEEDKLVDNETESVKCSISEKDSMKKKGHDSSSKNAKDAKNSQVIRVSMETDVKKDSDPDVGQVEYSLLELYRSDSSKEKSRRIEPVRSSAVTDKLRDDAAKPDIGDSSAQVSRCAIAKKKNSFSMESDVKKDSDPDVGQVEYSLLELYRSDSSKEKSRRIEPVRSSAVTDKLRDDAAKPDIGDSSAQVSRCAIAKKKNSFSMESDVKEDSDPKIGQEELHSFLVGLHRPDSSKEKSRRTESVRSSASTDKLRDAAAKPDVGDSSAQVSFSAIAKKKNNFSMESDVKSDSDVGQEEPRSFVELYRPGSSKEKSRRTESVRSSAVTDKLRDAAANPDVGDSSAQVSWSAIVKKKNSFSMESDVKSDSDVGQEEPRSFVELYRPGSSKKKSSPEPMQPPAIEEKVRRTSNPSESLDNETNRESKSAEAVVKMDTVDEPLDCPLVDLSSSSELEEKKERSKLNAGDEKDNDDAVPDPDPAFSKEDSSEPERDPEKRSDSEQEAAPKCCNSSDELNGWEHVVYTDGYYSSREVVERSVDSGSNPSSVAISKKGNRSKKKKRR